MILYPSLSGCGAVGSALDWGSRGRKFKSSHSDQKGQMTIGYLFFFCFNPVKEDLNFPRLRRTQWVVCVANCRVQPCKSSHSDQKRVLHLQSSFLFNPKDWYVITRQRVCNRRRRMASLGACNPSY